MKHTFYFKLLEIVPVVLGSLKICPAQWADFLRFCLKEKKCDPQQYTSYPSYCV